MGITGRNGDDVGRSGGRLQLSISVITPPHEYSCAGQSKAVQSAGGHGHNVGEICRRAGLSKRVLAPSDHHAVFTQSERMMVRPAENAGCVETNR